MNVQVYGPLRSATGSKVVEIDSGELPGRPTVRDVLDALCAAHPRSESHLRDEDGALRPSVRVTVGDDRADLDDHCPPDADVRVFPAMRGG
ncbi:MoaD/ThiS family protein [Halobaculum magnesiiphilum]|uniref:MoaD/ThiS family protein n=1 Tax=Halobaculum magnesiiphilum TaxID=1017351 RepID=A0A8T8WHS0_9EURY|nr:MoaD/ThiS family protein [Halobaculum magnesiiphilum]QZP39422.1 MoaD/ThiS family protein [Halobaculum magnesiiphilum]